MQQVNKKIKSFTFIIDVFEPRRRYFKVSRIGQAIRTDWPQIGQLEMIIINFQNVSAWWFIIYQIHRESHALLNHTNFIWCNRQSTEFGFYV